MAVIQMNIYVFKHSTYIHRLSYTLPQSSTEWKGEKSIFLQTEQQDITRYGKPK